jgi:hypothetical protein
MPSRRSSGSSAASGSRVHSEYSVCRAVSGWMAWARRIVSGLASDRPMWSTLPWPARSARAPAVSSMGVSGSTRKPAHPRLTSYRRGADPPAPHGRPIRISLARGRERTAAYGRELDGARFSGVPGLVLPTSCFVAKN